MRNAPISPHSKRIAFAGCSGWFSRRLLAARRNSDASVFCDGGRQPCGFTLIELLVVIAIIGVLISLVFPSLTAAQKRARQVACSSNLRAIGVGSMIYANDHGGRLPPNTKDGNIKSPRFSTFGAHVCQPAMKMSSAPPWFTPAQQAFHAPTGIIADQRIFYPPSQSEFVPDPNGWFRQPSGSYRIGYIWFYFDRADMTARGAWWDPLLPYANSRLAHIVQTVPLASSFGITAVHPNAGWDSQNIYLNVLFTDGSVRSHDRLTIVENIPPQAIIVPALLAEVFRRM